ncbi:hypothetical protein Tco_0106740, partial [Tanacetum coccineum]
EFITLTLTQFGQILKIPYNGQAVFTNEWDLASLKYSQETEGPYCTNLPTPDDIRQLHTIKILTVSLNPNQILTKELSLDMKQWEELIRENVFGLGGNRDRLPVCLAHMLYYVVVEEQYKNRMCESYSNCKSSLRHVSNSSLSTRHGNVSSS